MTKNRDDELYLDLVTRISKQSRAVRLQVGALLVNEGVMIMGYNGTPAGWDNCCEDKIAGENGSIELKTKSEVIHAEMNVFKKVANNPNVIKGGTLYITHSPCVECAKLFIGMGLRKVVYINKYRSNDGITLLKKDGIEIVCSINEKPTINTSAPSLTNFNTLLENLPTEDVSIGDNVKVEPSKDAQIALQNFNMLLESLPTEFQTPDEPVDDSLPMWTLGLSEEDLKLLQDSEKSNAIL